MTQTANATNTPALEDFFLPDLCNMKAVLRLLVATELLAIFFARDEPRGANGANDDGRDDC